MDHKKQALVPKVKMKRKPTIDLKKATRALPAPAKKKPAKSKAQKDKDMREKVIQFIIDNKDVLDDERLK